MKLDLDAAFARLEDLQRRMGVREEARVPAAELRKLGQSGIEVELDDVRPAPGGNLSWKGQAVLLYIRDQYGAPSNGWSQYKYHLAECTTIQSMRTQGRGDKYLVTNRTDGWFPVRTSAYGGGAETTVRMNVCRNCLYLLDWDGYRSTPRTKDAAYRAFDLREFFAPPPPPAGPSRGFLFLLFFPPPPPPRGAPPPPAARRTAPGRPRPAPAHPNSEARGAAPVAPARPYSGGTRPGPRPAAAGPRPVAASPGPTAGRPDALRAPVEPRHRRRRVPQGRAAHPPVRHPR